MESFNVIPDVLSVERISKNIVIKVELCILLGMTLMMKRQQMKILLSILYGIPNMEVELRILCLDWLWSSKPEKFWQGKEETEEVEDDF